MQPKSGSVLLGNTNASVEDVLLPKRIFIPPIFLLLLYFHPQAPPLSFPFLSIIIGL
jgi:hypothetical protein